MWAPSAPAGPPIAFCGDGIVNQPSEECEPPGTATCDDNCQILVDGKVTICHKGKRTLRIGSESVSDHLGHGDTVGACP